VFFAGWRGHDDLPQALAACDAVVMPSVNDSYPRWLLAATGLEALAVGTIGAQETVSGQLDADERRALIRAIGAAIETAGLPEMVDRVVQRVLGTATGPVADHVHRYLADHGIHDAPPADINRWWRTRGALAHGGAVDIDPGDLNHLITVFQVALRRTAGAEAIPLPLPTPAPPDPPPGAPAPPGPAAATGGPAVPRGSEHRSPPPSVEPGQESEPAAQRTGRRWRGVRWRPKWWGG
jgi:hypothetical protein